MLWDTPAKFTFLLLKPLPPFTHPLAPLQALQAGMLRDRGAAGPRSGSDSGGVGVARGSFAGAGAGGMAKHRGSGGGIAVRVCFAGGTPSLNLAATPLPRCIYRNLAAHLPEHQSVATIEAPSLGASGPLEIRPAEEAAGQYVAAICWAWLGR